MSQRINQQRNLKNTMSPSKIEIQHTKTYGCNKISSKREVPSYKCLHQETRKISNYLTLYLEKLEKEEQMKSKVTKRKEIKIKVEINERLKR